MQDGGLGTHLSSGDCSCDERPERNGRSDSGTRTHTCPINTLCIVSLVALLYVMIVRLLE